MMREPGRRTDLRSTQLHVRTSMLRNAGLVGQRLLVSPASSLAATIRRHSHEPTRCLPTSAGSPADIIGGLPDVRLLPVDEVFSCRE